jgi:hypothetical protein
MISSAEELGNFMMDYYRTGTHQQLAEALEYAATTHDFRDLHTRNLALYFFARIARLHPMVVSEYEKVLEGLSRNRRHFVLSVLQLSSGVSPQELPKSLESRFPIEFDVCDRPITYPGDLDYLWTEFSIAGKKEPVHRIIDVLRWPDRVRSKLEEWLQMPASGFFAKWREKRALGRLQSVADIVCDVTANTIKTSGDLDLHVLSRGQQAGFSGIRGALPFRLSQDDVNYVATKWTAEWSLSNMAATHTMVLEVCKQRVNELPEGIRLSLLEVISLADAYPEARDQ